MTAANPAHRMFRNTEKEGGTRVEVDCQKVPCPYSPHDSSFQPTCSPVPQCILVIRLTVPHKKTGKTEMTKVNVDYPAIALVSPATHSWESRPGYTAPPRPSRTPRSASSTTS